VEVINKKRFILCFILALLFLSTNVINIGLFTITARNNAPTTAYAAGSRSSGGGFKSSSFSSTKSMPKSTTSGSKSSSSGFKSGGFSKTKPNNDSSKSGSTNSNNYSSGSKNSFIPIPIPFFSHNSYSSGGFFGAGHIASSLMGGLFKFILFIIVIVFVINILRKSKRH
jgi:uncharacterized membrane protein